MSVHPLRAFVRSQADSGLTQHAGQWTVIEGEYPLPFAEYKARAESPWPTEHPACVVVDGDRGGDDAPPAGLPNRPLPVTPSSKAVGRAIADRLRELQDEIRGGEARPPQPRPGA